MIQNVPNCWRMLSTAMYYWAKYCDQVLGPSIGLHQKFCKALRLRYAGGKTHSISASAAANTTAPACNTAVGQFLVLKDLLRIAQDLLRTCFGPAQVCWSAQCENRWDENKWDGLFMKQLVSGPWETMIPSTTSLYTLLLFIPLYSWVTRGRQAIRPH